MTAAEFDTEFDVLYNNITSKQAPGINAYEKSVFLTKAQTQILTEYFNGRTNNPEGGFDGSPKRQIDFSNLIEWNTVERITQNIPKFDPRSLLYIMPDNALFIVDEQLSLLDYSSVDYNLADTDTFYSVVPISYEDYNRLMSKPYKYPPKSQAWRLITKKTDIEIPSSTIPAYTSYTIVHTQKEVYARIGNEDKLVFTIDYDSNSTDANPVNLAIVTQGFDISGLSDIEVFEIQDMNAGIESTLDTFIANSNINNIAVSVEPDFINTSWNTLWNDKLIVLAVNGGSIPEYHEEEITESETKSVQILEVIGRFESVPFYRIRYVRRPSPIIIEPRLDLLKVSIEGIGYGDGQIYGPTNTTIRECELPIELHSEILERAVTLAKISWQGLTGTQVAIASNSNNR